MPKFSSYLRISVHQDFSDQGVGQPLIASDHTGIKRNTPFFSGGIVSQLGCQSKSVRPWMETTDLIGKFCWKHRDSAVRKIDAGATRISFVVQSSLITHIVTDIGDGNVEFHASILFFFNGDGIIEISCIFSVNGEGRNTSQVTSTLGFM